MLAKGLPGAVVAMVTPEERGPEVGLVEEVRRLELG